MQCRYCLSNDNSPSNKLICPCKCIGSLQFVHSNCLKNWIKNCKKRVIKHHERNRMYYGVKCELCNGECLFYLKFKNWLLFDIMKFFFRILTKYKNFPKNFLFSSLLYVLVKKSNELGTYIYYFITRQYSISTLSFIWLLITKIAKLFFVCVTVKNLFKRIIKSNINLYKREFSIDFLVEQND